DGIRDDLVTGVQTCALPIFSAANRPKLAANREGAIIMRRSLMKRQARRQRVAGLNPLSFSADPRRSQPSQSGNISRTTAWEFWRSEERRVGKEDRCGCTRKY